MLFGRHYVSLPPDMAQASEGFEKCGGTSITRIGVIT